MSTVEQKPLSWVDEAWKHLGIKERKGKDDHHPEILKMLEELNLPWSEDETAWCGTFVSACLKRAKRAYPTKAPAWAKAHRNNGARLLKPAYGSVAVKERKGGGGHVFFVVGKTKEGKIVGLGGNQSDSVNLTLFNHEELTYNWPATRDGRKLIPTTERYNLPIYDSKTLKPSVKED